MTDVDDVDVDHHMENGAGSTTDVDDMSLKNAKSMEEAYHQQIENLKEQVKEKDQHLKDLEKGLDAQVAMVMELEKLEEKELQEYEAKLVANKKLITELGERVGMETKAKAELESQLQYVQAKNKDQATQIERLEELNKVNTELLKAVKSQDEENQKKNGKSQHDNNHSKWEALGKVEYLMETNQKLVMELAQAQEDMQRVRKDVSDKELLCLELSSQLDKLASQLNSADEDMAGVKYQLKQKEDQFKKSDDRVKTLEQALLEPQSEGDETMGKAVLMRKLKDKEDVTAQMKKERDVALAKATKLSLALASTREHVDALQEKLEYQNSIVDRILGKGRNPPSSHTNNNHAAAAPTKTLPKRHASFGSKKAVEHATTTDGEAQRTGPFDGRRIRNFFNRGRTGSNAEAAVANNNTAAAAADTSNNKALPKPATVGLFGRRTSSESAAPPGESSERGLDGSSSAADPNIVQPKADGNTNPFDDDHNASFVNTSVGKESHIDEAVQGGGGDVNLALTI
ncbi:expressed unknown protein [Seminavis robusta]|uniref:Uncharacterized protein n=1 Tax=Seminavis robusta TaxID=568900 RepID=A0A9N8H728_9STRA|nr:expressed unknown protein [Seminavis robusta]|eukprot:Sro165_g073890.1 n/a (515) ;mRNA; f:52466-54010